jgi:hypothetical protein
MRMSGRLGCQRPQITGASDCTLPSGFQDKALIRRPEQDPTIAVALSLRAVASIFRATRRVAALALASENLAGAGCLREQKDSLKG